MTETQAGVDELLAPPSHLSRELELERDIIIIEMLKVSDDGFSHHEEMMELLKRLVSDHPADLQQRTRRALMYYHLSLYMLWRIGYDGLQKLPNRHGWMYDPKQRKSVRSKMSAKKQLSILRRKYELLVKRVHGIYGGYWDMASSECGFPPEDKLFGDPVHLS